LQHLVCRQNFTDQNCTFESAKNGKINLIKQRKKEDSQMEQENQFGDAFWSSTENVSYYAYSFALGLGLWI